MRLSPGKDRMNAVTTNGRDGLGECLPSAAGNVSSTEGPASTSAEADPGGGLGFAGSVFRVIIKVVWSATSGWENVN